MFLEPTTKFISFLLVKELLFSMSVAGSVVSPGDELTLQPGLLSHKVEGSFKEFMEKILTKYLSV